MQLIRGGDMAGVQLSDGLSAAEFRSAAAAAKDANQARRLLALAAVREGQSREDAARVGGMTRQTLRDWVHAYNGGGIAALINGKSTGRPAKLADDIRSAIKTLVDKGADFEKDGVVRFRRCDLVRIVKETHGVLVSDDTIGRTLRAMGYSHISVRPQHPHQKEGAIEDFKKNSSRHSLRG